MQNIRELSEKIKNAIDFPTFKISGILTTNIPRGRSDA
jgi:hypothetical protein